jgi:hypothetical protein
MATFSLTTGNDVVAAPASGSTVYANAATLNPGDSLTGGPGVDVLDLVGAGTFDLSGLVNFSGFEKVELQNAGLQSAFLTLNGQPIEVDFTGHGQLSVGSQSNWNGSDIVNGDTLASTWITFGAPSYGTPYTYDLTSNTFANVGTVATGSYVTLKINSADAAGIQRFSGGGTGTLLQTSDATLDLTHTTVTGMFVTSSNALGTTFTVADLGTALQVEGGPGHDALVAQGFTFTADQRNEIFKTSSIETIKDSSGMYMSPQSEVAGDFTGSGTSDILLQNGGNLTDWLINNGSFSSSNAITTGLPAAWSVVGTGDFTGNGTADILLQAGGTLADWLINNGSFSSSNTIATGLPAGWNVVGTGDFNGDGTSDILLKNGGSLAEFLINNNTLSGSSTITTGLPVGWNVVGTGDFNGDGTSDILLQNGGSLADWLISNGVLLSSNTITTGLPTGWHVVGTGDFNGDGTSDILLQNGSSVTDWLMNNGTLSSSTAITTGLPAGWNVIATGDYNGDGTTDILLQNGGSVADWIINNGSLSSSNTLTTGLPGAWKVIPT